MQQISQSVENVMKRGTKLYCDSSVSFTQVEVFDSKPLQLRKSDFSPTTSWLSAFFLLPHFDAVQVRKEWCGEPTAESNSKQIKTSDGAFKAVATSLSWFTSSLCIPIQSNGLIKCTSHPSLPPVNCWQQILINYYWSKVTCAQCILCCLVTIEQYLLIGCL